MLFNCWYCEGISFVTVVMIIIFHFSPPTPSAGRSPFQLTAPSGSALRSMCWLPHKHYWSGLCGAFRDIPSLHPCCYYHLKEPDFVEELLLMAALAVGIWFTWDSVYSTVYSVYSVGTTTVSLCLCLSLWGLNEMVYLIVTGRVPSYHMCSASFPFFFSHGFVLKSPSFPSPLQYIQKITSELIFSQHNFFI